jgi:hypothetical protein
MNEVVRIGNAQGFWGDRPGSAARLIGQQPNLDYITMDYLAEVSMSILARQRDKNPSLGYAQDLLHELNMLIPFWKQGMKFKLVTNGGGLNPLDCAKAASEILQGIPLKVGVVYGDDVISIIKKGGDFKNLETEESLDEIQNTLVTANAYFGAQGIVQALEKGADIVITGRTADPSLTVGPCVHHFGWKWKDYDKLAGATVAGHLIECGAQVTGGIYTNWLDVPDVSNIGFPFVEVSSDGSFIITKPEGTGGMVNENIVKEQLLYEIGDPDRYLSPDVTVSFLSLALNTVGKDRVQVTGAKGSPPPDTYKVSATYRSGYMAEGTLTLFGNDLYKKAHRCGEMIIDRVKQSGYDLENYYVECLGGGDVVPQVISKIDVKECVLRVTAQDSRKEALESFSKEFAPLVTSGPQGTTGYFSARPKVREVYGYWPTTIPVKKLKPIVEMIEVHR